MRYLKQFDVRRYGAKAGYVDATNAASLGRNNTAAFQACAADMNASGGGDMVIDHAKYGYWLNDSVTFTTSYCRVRNEGVVRFEPTSAKSLFRWEATTDTTLFSGGIEGGQIRGHHVDDPNGGTRYPKSAYELVCCSNNFITQTLVSDWVSNTGSTPCKALRNRGKEELRASGNLWNTERCVSIEANPKERTGPAGPIDADHVWLQSNRYNMPVSGTYVHGSAIHVDPDLNFLNFIADGNNNAAGGGYIFYWDDPAGGALHRDSVGLILRGFRGEQMTGTTTTANVHISRRGVAPAFGVLIDDVSCNITTTGIRLEGTRFAKIRDCRYFRFDAQDTSPMALVLDDASCLETVVERYHIPRVPSAGPAVDLFDVGTLTPFDNDGTALTWPRASGASQFYDYQSFQ